MSILLVSVIICVSVAMTPHQGSAFEFDCSEKHREDSKWKSAGDFWREHTDDATLAQCIDGIAVACAARGTSKSSVGSFETLCPGKLRTTKTHMFACHSRSKSKVTVSFVAKSDIEKWGEMMVQVASASVVETTESECSAARKFETAGKDSLKPFLEYVSAKCSTQARSECKIFGAPSEKKPILHNFAITDADAKELSFTVSVEPEWLQWNVGKKLSIPLPTSVFAFEIAVVALVRKEEAKAAAATIFLAPVKSLKFLNAKNSEKADEVLNDLKGLLEMAVEGLLVRTMDDLKPFFDYAYSRCKTASDSDCVLEVINKGADLKPSVLHSFAMISRTEMYFRIKFYSDGYTLTIGKWKFKLPAVIPINLEIGATATLRKASAQKGKEVAGEYEVAVQNEMDFAGSHHLLTDNQRGIQDTLQSKLDNAVKAAMGRRNAEAKLKHFLEHVKTSCKKASDSKCPLNTSDFPVDFNKKPVMYDFLLTSAKDMWFQVFIQPNELSITYRGKKKISLPSSMATFSLAVTLEFSELEKPAGGVSYKTHVNNLHIVSGTFVTVNFNDDLLDAFRGPIETSMDKLIAAENTTH